MTTGVMVFLAGLYVMPLVLLAWGHGLRRRSPRVRRAFWGAILGHCVAATLALVAGLYLPETWTSEETSRGVLGLWSLLILPLVGAGAAAATRRERG